MLSRLFLMVLCLSSYVFAWEPRPDAIKSVVLVETPSGKKCTGVMLSAKSLVTSPECAKEKTIAVNGYSTRDFRVADPNLALIVFQKNLAKELDIDKFFSVGKNGPRKPDELTFYDSGWRRRRNTVSGEKGDTVTFEEKDGDLTDADFQGGPSLNRDNEIVGVIVGSKNGVLTVRSLFTKPSLQALVDAGIVDKSLLATLPQEPAPKPQVATTPTPIPAPAPRVAVPVTPKIEVLPAPAPVPRAKPAPKSDPYAHSRSTERSGWSISQTQSKYIRVKAGTREECEAYLGTYQEVPGETNDWLVVDVTYDEVTSECRLWWTVVRTTASPEVSIDQYGLFEGWDKTQKPSGSSNSGGNSSSAGRDYYITKQGTRMSSHSYDNYNSYYPETASSWAGCKNFLGTDYEVGRSPSRGSTTVRIDQVEWDPKTQKCYLYYSRGEIDRDDSDWTTVSPRTTTSSPASDRLQRRADRIRSRR